MGQYEVIFKEQIATFIASLKIMLNLQSVS